MWHIFESINQTAFYFLILWDKLRSRVNLTVTNLWEKKLQARVLYCFRNENEYITS